MEVHLQIQPNRRSRSSLTAPDSHLRVVYVNSWSFAWSSTFRPGVSLKSDAGGDDGLLSTLVNKRTSVAADDRVTSRRYMVRYRCLSLSCDHAVSLRIFDPHLRPCLQRRKFECAVSGVKGCFLVTSMDRLFRSQV